MTSETASSTGFVEPENPILYKNFYYMYINTYKYMLLYSVCTCINQWPCIGSTGCAQQHNTTLLKILFVKILASRELYMDLGCITIKIDFFEYIKNFGQLLRFIFQLHNLFQT